MERNLTTIILSEFPYLISPSISYNRPSLQTLPHPQRHPFGLWHPPNRPRLCVDACLTLLRFSLTAPHWPCHDCTSQTGGSNSALGQPSLWGCPGQPPAGSCALVIRSPHCVDALSSCAGFKHLLCIPQMFLLFLFATPNPALCHCGFLSLQNAKNQPCFPSGFQTDCSERQGKEGEKGREKEK